MKDILKGEGFKDVKPHYLSKPDIRSAEINHQALHESQNDNNREYGLKQNLRSKDPEMKQILSWGAHDVPMKNDFTSNKGAYTMKSKINKLGVTFITEAKDNFRDHKNGMSYEEQLMSYVQSEN